MYMQEPKILGVFVSDVRASDFRTLGRLEPSKIVFERVGGPRLGLDTSLTLTFFESPTYTQYLINLHCVN